MRFDNVKYDEITSVKHYMLKKMFEEIEAYADLNIITGRSKAMFMTKLEECFMWAGKSLKEDQEDIDKNTKERS